MRRLLLLALPMTLALSACSSTRDSSRSPDGRVIRTPSGDVIVADDGRIYRDANRNGIPDTREGDRARRTDNRRAVCHNGRTLVVAGPAVNAHVRHGDYVGSCRSDRNDRYEQDRRNGDWDDDHDDRRERGRDRKDDKRGRGRGRGH